MNGAEKRRICRPVIELLEARRLLSASNASEPTNVGWFGTLPTSNRFQFAGASTASVEWGPYEEGRAPAGSTADRWIVKVTDQAAATMRTPADGESILPSSEGRVRVAGGLGRPGFLLIESYASREHVEQLFASIDAVEYFLTDSPIAGQDLPNDPQLSELDGLELIDAESAWEIFAEEGLPVGSTDVVVGILDTGIDLAHRDLYLNVWLNQGEIPQSFADVLVDTDADGRITFRDLNEPDNEALVLDRNANGYIDAKDLLADPRWVNDFDEDGNSLADDLVGWDFHNNDNDPSDDHRHGTHVAGTIGAIGDNATDVAGINWRTSMMALKVLDENNRGLSTEAMLAVNYAAVMRIDHDVNVRITNSSFVGSEFDPAMQDAIAQSEAADILFVAAAGNGDVFGEGENIDVNPRYPASYDVANIISVTATNSEGLLAAFSNFGSCDVLADNGEIDCSVDIAAPGVGIVSTTTSDDVFGPFTASRNGTSMAAPHVSAVAALIFSRDPDASGAEVREAIFNSARRMPNLDGVVATGGLVNARGALEALQEAPTARLVRANSIALESNAPLPITVEYRAGADVGGIDITTIDDTDILIRRDGFPNEELLVSLQGVCWSVAEGCVDTRPVGSFSTAVQATYLVQGPTRHEELGYSEAWHAIDNGDYRIELQSGAIRNQSGVGNRNATLTQADVDYSFQVRIDDPNVYFVTTNRDDEFDIFSTEVSLRLALLAANASSEPIAIVLPPNEYRLDIAGANEDFALTGDLDIRGNLTIVGAGKDTTLIDGNGLDRVFHVHPDSTFRLVGVTISGGAAPLGGGLKNDGGLVGVLQSDVTANAANDAGGGIWNDGNFALFESTIDSNQTTSPLKAGGGGIYNSGNLRVNNSTISNNRAAGGFVGQGGGGGIYVASSTTEQVSIVNTTISGNQATSGDGGGVNQSAGRLSLVHTTISDNDAAGFGGGVAIHGIASRATDMANAIVAGNRASREPDLYGPINAVGTNLIGALSDETTASSNPLWGTTAFPVDALLGPLLDNGGITKTHVPLPDSPAISAGSVLDQPIDVDQRGIPRSSAAAPGITLGSVQKHFVEIRGRLFHDVDGDGERGSTEQPLSDWIVYVDSNANEVLDPGEPNTITRLDDPSTLQVDESEYVISGLDPSVSEVEVRTIARSGFVDSTPIVVNVDERTPASASLIEVVQPTERILPVFHLDFSAPASQLTDISAAQLPIQIGSSVSTLAAAGPTLENGRTLDAGRWAGVDDDTNEILIFDHPTLDEVSQTAGSITTWIKVDSEDDWNGIVLTKCDPEALDKTRCDQFSPTRGLEFEVNSESGVFGSVQGWNTNNFGPRHRTNGGPGGAETPSGVWTHVALTWNDDGDHTIYVNGVKGRTIEGVGAEPFGLNQPRNWTIGGDDVPLNSTFRTNDENRRRLQGELADFAIFNDELDGQAINEVIRNGVPKPVQTVFHLGVSAADQIVDVSNQQLPIRVGERVEAIPRGGPVLEGDVVLDSVRWADRHGVENRIDILDSPALDSVSTAAGTVVTWVKVDDDSDWNTILATSCDGGPQSCDPSERGIRLETDREQIGSVSGAVQGSANRSFGPLRRIQGTGGTETPSGVWTHLAMTWNDLGDHTIYVNGLPGSRVPGAGGDAFGQNETGDWIIGDDPFSELARNLHGELADFAILDGELDRLTINDIMRFGVPRPTAPVFHLDFRAAAAELEDVSGNDLSISVGAAVQTLSQGGPNLQNGVQLAAGRWPGLDSDANEIRVLDNPVLDHVSRNAGAIVTWVKVDSSQEWNGLLKTRCEDHTLPCDTFSPTRGIELAMHPESGVFGGVQGWSTNNYGPSHVTGARADEGEIRSGVWTHVALTWNDAGDHTIYVNGVPGETVFGVGDEPFGRNDPRDWTIGGDGLQLTVPAGDSNNRRLQGDLADFAIFDRTLQAREIEAIMNVGVAQMAAAEIRRGVQSLASFDDQPSIVGNRIVFEDHLGRVQVTDGEVASPLVGLNTVSTESQPFADGESISYDGEFVAFSGRLGQTVASDEVQRIPGIFVVNQFGAFQELVSQGSVAPGTGTFEGKAFDVHSISNSLNALVAFGVRERDEIGGATGGSLSSTANEQGLYAADSGGVAVLVDTTTRVPGTNRTFRTFGDAQLDESTFAFHGTFDGGFGIYENRGTGALQTVVDHSTTIPNGDAASTTTLTSIESFAFSNGEVVFHGVGDVQEGIYFSNSDGVRVIADRSTDIPGDVGKFQSFGEVAFDQGNAVFVGRGRSSEESRKQGLHEQVGIYVALDGQIQRLADLQPVGQPPAFGGRTPVSLSIGPEAISGSRVVFYAAFADGSDGIFTVEFTSESKHTISVAPGAVIDGLDFGRTPLPGEIQGVSYFDINRNGRRDFDEPGLPGWTIFLDQNTNGALDPGEASTNTGETGEYRFKDVPTLQNYAVRQVPQENWVGTSSFGLRHAFFLNANESRVGIDFGNRPTVQVNGQGGNGRIRVVIFEDQNGNGRQDSGEPTSGDQDVYIDINNNGLFDAGVDALPRQVSGAYEFTNLTLASHEVRLRRSNEFQQTTPLGNSFESFTRDNVGDRPTAVVAGQFDDDGLVDLIVGNNTSNTLSILSNAMNPVGTVTSTINHGGSGPISIVVADLNLDGREDLAVANFHSSDISVLIQQVDGGFQLPTVIPVGENVGPVAIVTANLDGDAYPDLVVSNSISNGLTLLRNAGDGTFIATHLNEPIAEKPQGIVAGRFDEDTLDDIVVVSQREQSVQLLVNNGDGTFTQQAEAAVGARPSAIVAGDFDNDSNLDVAVANIGSASISIMFGDGEGKLTRTQNVRVNAPPIALARVDIDGDNDLDLIFTRAGDLPVSLLRNDGTGRFQSAAFNGATDFLDTSALPFSVAASDVNGDTEVDLILARRDSDSLTILENRVVAGSHRVTLGTNQPDQIVAFGIRLNNKPPSFAIAAPPIIEIDEDSSWQTIHLTDLSGGTEEDQQFRIAVRSDNEELIPSSNLVVDHVAGAHDATLRFLPKSDAYGSAILTVELSDTGFDGKFDTLDDGRSSQVVRIDVLPVNDQPTLDFVFVNDHVAPNSDPSSLLVGARESAIRVDLFVSAGENERDQPIAISAESSNERIVPGFTRQSFDTQRSRGTVFYAVDTSQAGVSTVTLSVEDGGLDRNLETLHDNATTTRSFQVTVISSVIQGDINLDGAVDFFDFLVFSQAFGSSNANHLQADFDNDGEVGFSDFIVLADNYGSSQS